jgi:diguanylate cyclase (GGDEF)-like protein
VLDNALPTSFAELSRLGRESRLEQGAYLWREGDPGDHVVLLLEGFLEVTHNTPEGQTVVLRTQETGAIVGEIAALDGRPRSATVRASTPCKIVRIPAPAFREVLRRRADILEDLYWMQVDRVRSLTRQVTQTHDRAITDPLTHLYNYGFFRERLGLELERARQTGDNLALIMFDIDHFKHFNDVHGHQDGNTVLVTVADILRTSGRRGDIVARYGGEEFVVLLYGATRDEAARFADSARVSIASHPFAGGETQPMGRVTVSGGVAAFPADASGDEALIKAADARLYRAKELGRDRIVSVAVNN